MLDPRRLVTLEAVGRTGTFAAAAAELGLTPSAVSLQISDLERACGLRLADRRPVRLTEAGEAALAGGRTIVDALGRVGSELRRHRDGELATLTLDTFASAGTRIAVPAIASLAAAHPGLLIRMRQAEPAVAEAALADGTTDLALTLDYDIAPVDPPLGVARELLLTEPMLVALPGDHALAARTEVTLAEVAQDPWVSASVAGLSLETLRARVPRAAFAPTVLYTGEDFATVLQMVEHGLGVALLPRMALPTTGHALQCRPLVEPRVERRIYLSRRHPSSAHPALDRLAAALRASAAPI